MNALITTTIYAAGDLQAAGIFGTIDSLAGSTRDTVLIVFTAGFFLGALITWMKNKFSVQSGILGLIMAAIGLAFLSQISAVQDMFSTTIEEETAEASVETAPAELRLDEPIVLMVDDLERAA